MFRHLCSRAHCAGGVLWVLPDRALRFCHLSPAHPSRLACHTEGDAFAQGRLANLLRRMKELDATHANRESVFDVTTTKFPIATATGLQSPPTDDPDVPTSQRDAAAKLQQSLSISQKQADSFFWKCTTNVSFVVSLSSMPTMATMTKGPMNKTKDAPNVMRSVVSFQAIGYALDERTAITAAAMHAEILLDGRGIHLFALPRMQEKHALQARSKNRWAPLPTEGPHDVPADAAPLPDAVLVTATSATGGMNCHRVSPVVVQPLQPQKVLRPQDRSKDATIHFGLHPLGDPSRAFQEYASGTVFRHSELGDDAEDVIQVSPRDMVACAIRPDEVVCDDTFTEGKTKIVQSEVRDEDSRGGCPTSPAAAPTPAGLPQNVRLLRQFYTGARLSPNVKDESEGGRYAMVERDSRWMLPQVCKRRSAGAQATESSPFLMCIYDSGSEQRWREAVQGCCSQLQCDESMVERIMLRCLPQQTAVAINTSTTENQQGNEDDEGPMMYSCSMTLPITLFLMAQAVGSISGIHRDALLEALKCSSSSWLWDAILVASDRWPIAEGKGESEEEARVLCHQHAERLFEQLGIRFFPHDNARDAALVDAGLQYGRRRSPLLLTDKEMLALVQSALNSRCIDDKSPSWTNRLIESLRDKTDAKLLRCKYAIQKPLKILSSNEGSRRKRRKRHSPLSPSEALLGLHRCVVAAQRINVFEVDTDVQYSDVLMEAEVLMRQYMQEHAEKSPLGAELPILTFELGPGQHRSTMYLPLPQEYNVRGGFAVGLSPVTSRRLCCLHALDILCALGVPVLRNPTAQRVFEESRRQRGLLVPPAFHEMEPNKARQLKSSLLSMRSPPGYREVAGAADKIPAAQYLWCVSMIDATSLDVARDVQDHYVIEARSKEEDTKLASPTTTTTTTTTKDKTLPPSPFGKQDELTQIRILVNAILKELCMSVEQRLRQSHVLAAAQRVGMVARVPANNMWLKLPLAVDEYGERIALGRCLHRRGAERCMLIHMLRTFLWLDVPEVAALLKREKQLDGIMKAFCAVHYRIGVDVPERCWNSKNSATDQKRNKSLAPSPNPVMSAALARQTFTSR